MQIRQRILNCTNMQIIHFILDKILKLSTYYTPNIDTVSNRLVICNGLSCWNEAALVSSDCVNCCCINWADPVKSCSCVAPSVSQSSCSTYCQLITSSSAVAKRPRNSSCLSVVSFNSTIRRVESYIVSYIGYSEANAVVKRILSCTKYSD